jgi:hypothetical protein
MKILLDLTAHKSKYTHLKITNNLTCLVLLLLLLSELTLGRLVGKGGFSLVFEVVKLDIDELYDISKRSASERRQVANESVDQNGMPRFAVKMLRDDLIEEEHSKGVIDLAVEARFLRRLSHPNIIAMWYVRTFVLPSKSCALLTCIDTVACMHRLAARSPCIFIHNSQSICSFFPAVLLQTRTL